MRKQFIYITLSVFLLLFVAGCSLLNKGIHVENDRVMKSRRVTYEAFFTNNTRHEQSYAQHLTFLKETDSNDNTKYTLYDVITLPVESFDLKNDMYIVADDDIITLPVTYQNQYATKNINEKKEDVLQADSTKKTVVTGYDVVNKKTIQMTHPLSNDVIRKISESRSLNLRYYVGPNVINTEIKGAKLRDVKKWITK